MGTADMNADGKSDESIVPAMHANNGATEASAEQVEESDSTDRNVGQANSSRSESRSESRTERKSNSLHHVREAARKDRDVQDLNDDHLDSTAKPAPRQA